MRRRIEYHIIKESYYTLTTDKDPIHQRRLPDVQDQGYFLAFGRAIQCVDTTN